MRPQSRHSVGAQPRLRPLPAGGPDLDRHAGAASWPRQVAGLEPTPRFPEAINLLLDVNRRRTRWCGQTIFGKDMTTRAKVCQYAILAYLACSIVIGIVSVFSSFQASQLRAAGIAGLVLAVRFWFLSQVMRRSRIWIWILGGGSIIAVLALPVWVYLRAQYIAPDRPFTWLQPHFLLSEAAMAVLAVCCFILASELRTEPKQPSEPTPTSVTPHAEA